MTAIEARWQAGVAALARGAPEAAIPLLQEAASAGEGGGFAALNLGLALEQLGRLDAAVTALEAAAAALPEHPEPLFRLGAIAGLRGELTQAEALLQGAVQRDPRHVTALAALAALAEDAGQLDTAAGYLARARAAEPGEPELDVAEARLALRRNQPEIATAHALSVLGRRPVHPGAARLYADALWRAEGAEAALATVAARAAADPLGANWALAAARLHARCGRPGAALAELRTADALAPDHPEITGLLGVALCEAGDVRAAERTLRAAIAARPTVLDLHNRLATLLYKQHRYAEMLTVLDAAVAAFGQEPTLDLNRALALNAVGEQRQALPLAEAVLPLPTCGPPGLITRLSILAYHPDRGTAAELHAAARAIDARLGPTAPAPPRPREPERRLRIGLLSGGFGQHPVGWLTLAGLEALPAEFELVGYAVKQREDWLAQRFRARCVLWRNLALADDTAIAEAIRADGCDILLDLGGYGDTGRPAAVHRRPAPVQIKWVGAQFATMGLGAIDWMLTDRWETPPGSEQHYTERLLRLPDGYVCYLPPPYAPPVGPLPALVRGHLTFGCFNNLAKVTPLVLDAWGEILRTLPTARCVLRTHALAEAATRARVAERFAERGIDPARIEMHGGVPHDRLLAAYNEIDIALDPFPYTGGLTVCESLWMGVPVVALIGDSFCARHAFSHLSNVGLADWAVPTRQAYVARALAAAANLSGLADLRAGLRARVAASPLTDAPRFGAGLGAALRQAWRAWCAA